MVDSPAPTSRNAELSRDAILGRYRVSDGVELAYRHWIPSAAPRGYVVALHGIQSHSGWYEYSSNRLCDAGYEVRFLDRRGSGQSGGPRGHAVHADRLLNDVAEILAEVCWIRDRSAPGVPVILLGVSWGGKLAAVLAARRPELLDGLALLYPGLCARVRTRWYHRGILRMAQALGAGPKPVRLPLEDPALFTGDPAWQEFVRNDPSALHAATVSFVNASVSLDEEVKTCAGAISHSTLVMLAGRDEIIDNRATREYLNRIAVEHLEVKEYPEARHTLEFEPNRDEIFTDLVDWLHGLRTKA